MSPGAGRPLLAAIAALLVALSACSSPSPASDPGEPSDAPSRAGDDAQGGGTLRVGLSADPASLDPRLVTDAEGELVLDAVFDPLVRLDRQQRIVPAAAERWERSDDGRVWTFELREATFHDGAPVTAADFVRGFQRIADGTASSASPLAYLLEPISGLAAAQEEGAPLSGVEAIDARTLRLTLDEPRPQLLRRLTHPSLVPVPASAEERPRRFAAQPIGNGPFEVSEAHEPGGFIRLSAVDDHPSAPALDAVVLAIHPDDGGLERQWQELVDGQLHVAELAPARVPEAIERFGRAADGHRGPGVLTGVTSAVYLYAVDTTVAPFDDPAVRRALSLAIDRQTLADELFPSSRLPATGIVPPTVPGAQQDACAHCRHAPDEAATLLDEAEDAPESLTLTHNDGSAHAAIADRLASQLGSALDVETTTESLPLDAFLTSVRSGEATLFRLGLDPGLPSMGEYLRPLLHSEAIGVENLARYASDDVDALLDAARGKPYEQAIEDYRAAERSALQDVALIPLLHYRHQRVVADDVQGLYISPYGRMDLTEARLQGQ